MNKEVSPSAAENGEDERVSKNVKEGEVILNVSEVSLCHIKESPWSLIINVQSLFLSLANNSDIDFNINALR